MARQNIENAESGLVVRNKLNENFTELYVRATVFAAWDATGNTLPVDADEVGSGTDGALQPGDKFVFGPGGGTIDGEDYPEKTIAIYLPNTTWRLF
jgi:hypothetical protein